MIEPDVARALAAAVRAHKAGESERAIEAYRTIIERAPDAADAWHMLGVAAHQKGDHDLARRLINTAIELAPTVADYHNNLIMVLRALGEMTAAEDAARRTLALKPDHGKALSNLAGLLRARGAFDDALAMAQRAVAAVPDQAEAHNNLGNALKELNRLDEAVAAYRTAIALHPDYALAHWNLSLALLTLGQYEEGFREYAWRWQWGGFLDKPRGYAQPIWRGEPIAGKTILLYPEQGIGDALHFVRYVPLVRARGARILIGVPPLLSALFRASFADEVVDSNPLPDFDVHAPFIDLPHIFATDLASVPAELPYLAAERTRIAAMRARSQGRGQERNKLRVGFNWSGNPASPVEHLRALPLDQMAPLAALTGIDWVCLQKGPGGDILPRPPGMALIETGVGPLVDTAALIATLDLVVTTDTAVAHLAGALAKPTFIMLHHAADWRWLVDRSDSPWYPTFTLFRQPKPGDWAAVVAAVAEALSKRV